METLFISDLHLDRNKPEISEHLLTFLKTRASSARVLYILGDLFETWLGDDDTADDFQAIFQALREFSTRSELYFLHGNRDFLVGESLAQRLGFTIIQDIEIIQLGTQRVALMHGDLLCTDDAEYQGFRQQVRSIEWKQQFLAKPLTERQAIAAHLRAQSHSAMKEKSHDIMDVNPEAVQQLFNRLGVDTLIHGHTHRPAIHPIPHNRQRIVLGDWNPEPSYLSWQEGRFSLIDNRI